MYPLQYYLDGSPRRADFGQDDSPPENNYTNHFQHTWRCVRGDTPESEAMRCQPRRISHKVPRTAYYNLFCQISTCQSINAWGFSYPMWHLSVWWFNQMGMSMVLVSKFLLAAVVWSPNLNVTHFVVVLWQLEGICQDDTSSCVVWRGYPSISTTIQLSNQWSQLWCSLG